MISKEKTYQGAWRLSTIHKGQYITIQYFDYTLNEAMQDFKDYLSTL